MDYFRIMGGRPLRGTLRVQGAKNSALPLLAATLLAGGESVLRRCPDLTDVRTALSILACLGCRVRREGDAVRVDASPLSGCQIPDGLMGRMRASVLFLGALLARTGEARSGRPGGFRRGLPGRGHPHPSRRQSEVSGEPVCEERHRGERGKTGILFLRIAHACDILNRKRRMRFEPSRDRESSGGEYHG